MTSHPLNKPPAFATPAGSERNQTLRTSEIRYRRLFEAAQDGIAILDADTGQIVDANPFLLTLLGYSLPEVLGKAIWEIGPLKDIIKSKTAFGTLKADKYVRYADLPLQAKDGRRIAVEFVSNIYPEDAGMVIQCNIRSIAEREKAEAMRRQSTAVRVAVAGAEEHLRLTRQIHDTVIQNLSLVNIKLGAVAQTTQHAARNEDLDQLRTARELLQESIAQCRMLMYDLTPPLLYELGLAPALEELITNLRERHGATVSFEHDGKTDTTSHAARGLLFDAARELIMNAVKHAGPCRIHCTLKRDRHDVRVCVQDDGAGFEAQRVAKKPGALGGFGLFNIRERVEGMHGRLEISSMRGQGTTATLTMPLFATRTGQKTPRTQRHGDRRQQSGA